MEVPSRKDTQQMAISDSDYKLLWGRAAGICSNPSCGDDLTVLLEDGDGFNVGEMAHIIARSPDGPRAKGSSGSDRYANLILLCPTCHRKIDKAPKGRYPAEMLHEWKRKHEGRMKGIGSTEVYENSSGLKAAVARLLAQNKQCWADLGPKSEVAQTRPASNMYRVWNMRKLDRIIPNNRKIINLIERNANLLLEEEYAEYLKFKNHAEAFELNQYERLDSYPLFPVGFARVFAA